MAKYLRRNRAGSAISSHNRFKETYLLKYEDDSGLTKEFYIEATSRDQATKLILNNIRQRWPQASFRDAPTLVSASIINTNGSTEQIYVNNLYYQNDIIDNI